MSVFTYLAYKPFFIFKKEESLIEIEEIASIEWHVGLFVSVGRVKKICDYYPV